MSRILLKKKKFDKALYESFRKSYNFDRFLATLLVQNGWSFRGGRFVLEPDNLNNLDPFIFKDVEKAAFYIINSVRSGKKIAIYGDYDADGITSSAILYLVLKKLGVEPYVYIPDRIKDGYGIQPENINFFRDLGIELVIAVDNGITSFPAVEYANRYGMSVIIVDHHLLENGNIPKALAVVNPWRVDDGSSFKSLSASALSFILSIAIDRLLKGRLFDKVLFFDTLISLAAIGIVADVMPIREENWLIVKNGIIRSGRTGNLGIKALMEVSGIEELNIRKIGFSIAPKLNVAGRIDNGLVAFNLLVSSNYEEALDIAKFLDGLNYVRQDIVKKSLNGEFERYDFKNFVCVVGDFHPGILGLIAQNLSKKLKKSVIVVSRYAKLYRGSGRSYNGFDIFSLLSNLKEHFSLFGGHKFAAGFTLKENKFKDFIEDLEKFSDFEAFSSLDDVIEYHGELEPRYITPQIVDRFNRLSPFGEGNPEPLFLLKDIKIIERTGNNFFIVETLDKSLRIKAKFPSDVSIDKEYFSVLYNLYIDSYMGTFFPSIVVKKILYDFSIL